MAPFPDPSPIGEGTPPHQTVPPRRLRRLDNSRLRRSTLPPKTKILDPPVFKMHQNSISAGFSDSAGAAYSALPALAGYGEEKGIGREEGGKGEG